MNDLRRRLDNHGLLIQKLMEVGGMPGLSLSVATQNQPVYHASYGLRDVELDLPVTPDTMFPVCSLAKGLSAAAMGILVDQGKASWDMLAKDAAPGFRSHDSFLRDHTTMADLYSHSSGMSSCGNLVNGCQGNILIDKEDCMKVVNHQTLVPERLGTFVYNSTAYDVCDDALENLSGSSVDTFLRENVFEALGLQRTFMKPPPAGTENVTRSYNALDDATPCCIPSPKLGENGVSSGSGGLWSSAVDLIKLYTCFIQSLNHESQTGESSTPGSPLKQIAQVMSPRVRMLPTATTEDVFYGLGWAGVQLPNSLGHIGLNGRLMPYDMPVVGKGAPSQLILYHQGTLPGALAVVVLVPEKDSVVLVMGNCLSLTDVPDWVSQIVLEEILGVPNQERVDFLAHAQRSIAINLEWHSAIVSSLARGRPELTTSPKSLELYVGTYIDPSGVFMVVVSLEKDVLCWAFQGLDSDKYELEHCFDDTFTWLQPRNALLRRGRWVLGNDIDPLFWKVEFKVSGHGKVTQLQWHHDASLSPIVYWRQQEREVFKG
ncbi:beta-lactamase domain-containing protein [Sarocladium implicatum]|nr:beta-lactamase domain-containing protein [Sarocladium implicatum]